MRQILFIILFLLPSIAFCTDGNKNSVLPKILVAAAPHNVSSEYYPLSMLAEDMKIEESILEKELNTKLISSITNNNPMFIPILDGCDNPKDLLSQNDADYVIVINDYNFDQRVKPMNTVFHIISYSLHNRNGECLLKGSDHYSTIELLEIDKLYPQMQKCSKKITKNILTKITSK